MVFTGEDNIARGVVETRDYGVGFVFLELGYGFLQVGSWDKFNIRKSLSGIPSNLIVSDFGEENFHELIIAHSHNDMIQWW